MLTAFCWIAGLWCFAAALASYSACVAAGRADDAAEDWAKRRALVMANKQ